MPEISRFFGIIIRMYYEREVKHYRPHFHAYVQDDSAVIALDPIEILESSLPVRQERLVMAWAELHREELLENWTRIMNEKRPEAIEPLRK